MYTCQHCQESGHIDGWDFQLDAHNRGFWCESCDGFTYFPGNAVKHRFTLILEEKNGVKPTCQPQKMLRKQLSPLRYPGGKSRVIDYLYSHLQKEKSSTLVSPFTGGGSFELALLDAGVVQQLHLNDLDTGIYSLWWTILYASHELVYKIENHTPTHRDYFEAQSLIKSNFFGANVIEAAWATLLVNRLAYSGISKANPLGGKNGSAERLLSRWKPAELRRRIERIALLEGKITITDMDAIELIEEAYWDESNTIFIDPPYLQKGKELYNCYYQKSDHLKLCVYLDSLHRGMPGADLLVTYDYHEWLEDIYEQPRQFIIGRQYSI